MKYKLFGLAVLLLPLIVNAAVKDEELQNSTIKLSSLTGVEHIELSNATSRYRISLPLSKRIKPVDRILHLDLVNSISLLEHRSQLVIVVNDIVMSQIQLSPRKPRVLADIPIPAEYLPAGYNTVDFIVNQHYTEDCEDPSASELWTQINAGKSYFSIDYKLQPPKFSVADFEHLFDKRLPDYEVTMLMGTDQLNDLHLKWGSLIGQGIALYQDYKMPNFKLATAKELPPLPEKSKEKPRKLSKYPLAPLDQSNLKGDAVLVGSVAELEPFLTEPQLTKITGPYIGVVPAKDPVYQVVVISGKTDEEVSMAAESFSFARQPYPDDESVIVRNFELPDIGDYKLPHIVQPGNTYEFSALGYKTLTLTHYPTEIELNLPPDLLSHNNEMVKLKLNLVYGAALREDSIINIYLNDLFQQAIRLDDPRGARYTDYEVPIPLRDFLAGRNILKLEPVMPPLISGSSGECSLIQDKNAKLTLFDDSTIIFPGVDHLASLPNFELLKRTGFPYTQEAFGSNLGVVVRDREPGAILAAWQLLSKLAQQAGTPLNKAEISFNTIPERDLFVISSRDALSQEDIDTAPMSIKDEMQLFYEIERVAKAPELSWMDKALGRTAKAKMLPKEADITLDAKLGRQALMTGYPSAEGEEQLITLITADTPDQLRRSVKDLVSPAIWPNLDGNLVIWSKEDNVLVTKQVGDRFTRGRTTLHNQLGYHFSNYLVQWVAGVFALIVIFAWFLHRWLDRYKATYHAKGKELET